MKSIEIDRSKRLIDQPGTGHNRWHPDLPPILEVSEDDTDVMLAIGQRRFRLIDEVGIRCYEKNTHKVFGLNTLLG